MAMAYRLLLIDFFNTLVLLQPSRLPRAMINGKPKVTTAGLIANALGEKCLSAVDVHQAMEQASGEVRKMYGEDFKEVPASVRFQKIIAVLGVNDPDGSISEEMMKLHMQAVAKSYTLPEAHKRTLEILGKYYQIGLLSNCDYSGLVRESLAENGLEERFHPLMISEEIGFRKPGRKAFQMAVDAAGLSVEQVLFVGDSLEDDVEGAQQAGMPVAWVNPKKEPGVSCRKPNFQIQGLPDLPGILDVKSPST